MGIATCIIVLKKSKTDNKTLFINIQHPGEGGDDITDPANPRAVSNWPDGLADGRPRSATVVIVKEDGGVIGS